MEVNLPEVSEDYYDTLNHFDELFDDLQREYRDMGFDIAETKKRVNKLKSDLHRKREDLIRKRIERRRKRRGLGKGKEEEMYDLEDEIEKDTAEREYLNSVLSNYKEEQNQIREDKETYMRRFRNQINAGYEVEIERRDDTEPNDKFGVVNVFYNFNPPLLFNDEREMYYIHSIEIFSEGYHDHGDHYDYDDLDNDNVFVRVYLTDDFPVGEEELLEFVKDVLREQGLPVDNLNHTESGTARIEDGFYKLLYIDGTW
jgi:hypothetical protein